jgi:hypothetical protein
MTEVLGRFLQTIKTPRQKTSADKAQDLYMYGQFYAGVIRKD